MRKLYSLLWVLAMTMAGTVAHAQTTFSSLEVVKEYAATLDYQLSGQYEHYYVQVDMNDIYDALGTDAASFDAGVASSVYSRGVEKSGDYYIFNDNLDLCSENDGWFGRYSGEDGSAMTLNANRSWWDGGTFYIQNTALSNGTFSFNHGQYPGTLKEGDADYVDLYIVNGTKAAKLTLTVNVTPPPYVPLSGLTQAGGETVEAVSVLAPAAGTFTLDVAAIAEALGCEVADLKLAGLADADNLSTQHTAARGGVWTSKEGYVLTWAGNETTRAIYVEPDAEGNFSSISYGFESGNWSTGDEANIPLYIYSGEKYYLVTIHVQVNEPEVEYNVLGIRQLSMEMVAGDGWEWSAQSVLDLDDVESQIGTKDFTLFTDKYVAGEGGESGQLEWSNTYTCSPYPGFWYGRNTYEDKDGQTVVENAGWGTNSFGVTYADGKITWWQNPNLAQAGDAWLANLYLVNVDTGASLQYVLSATFISESTTEQGDVNADGEVNISDVTQLVNIILEKAAIVPAADVNGDGDVNISDVTALVNMILGKN